MGRPEMKYWVNYLGQREYYLGFSQIGFFLIHGFPFPTRPYLADWIYILRFLFIFNFVFVNLFARLERWLDYC